MQINRPLIWILASYLAGILLNGISVFCGVVIFSFITIIIITQFIYLYNTGSKASPYYFLILLPFFFILGFYLTNVQMKPSTMDLTFDEEMDVTLQGELIAIEEKGKYQLLTLEEVSVINEDLLSEDTLNEDNLNEDDLNEDNLNKENLYDDNLNKENLNKDNLNKDNLNENIVDKDSLMKVSTTKKIILNRDYNNVLKNTRLSNKILVYNSKISQYRLGNILKVSGTLKKFQVASNPGQFNEYQYYKNKRFDYKINSEFVTIENADYNIFFETIYQLKLKFQNVYNSILSQKQSGILSAMILGDTNSLDEEVNSLYKQNGISHIIAISGLHISLLGLTLYKLLRRLSIPMLPSTLASVFLLYVYGILTGFGVSTNRSIVMLVLYMISLLVGRTYDLLSSTALSAILILIQNPMELFNAGFLLSFGAILAVGTIYPTLKKLLPIQNPIFDSLLMCFAIQMITTPILLFYFYEIPTYSVLINLLIIPLSSLVILLAVIAVLLGSIYLPLGVFFVGGAHFLLIFFEEVCKLALQLPFRRILTGRPDWLTIITYFLVIIVFLLINQKIVKKSSLIVLAFTCIIFIKPTSSAMEVTFLDVGQGDGIVINLPNDMTFMIDGGSTSVSKVGRYRIETFLKYKGISDIDYAIVTHTDKDHISGLQELMEAMGDKGTDNSPNNQNNDNKSHDNKNYQNINQGNTSQDSKNQTIIKNLVLPDTILKDDSYNALVALAQQKGISLFFIKKGDVFQIEDITITCLHPTKEFIPNSKNAYSTVLSLNYKEFDLLLTGDLEAEGEELVNDELLNDELKKCDNNGYEVLKVAHHGSKYSSKMEFLNLVKPQYAVISSGKNNKYGHPHEELLQRIKEVTDNILITHKSGAVTIMTNGEKMRVWEYLKDKK